MCGISGILQLDGSPADASRVERMIGAILHRGPDQGAVITDGSAALGNRRLAILDLSPAGALPMRSHDGRFTLAYNGEVYNHLVLRDQLPALRGVNWRSTSDAETIIELYRAEGENVLQHLRGMFALALWDNVEQTLFIARDRMGEKPLYYHRGANVFAFASEIKSLLMHPDVPRESIFTQQPSLLAEYLAFGYLPAPHTAFERIHALRPGHMIIVRGESVKVTPYWTPPRPADSSPVTDERAAAEQVRAALSESVKQCLLSDVPLGAFLSGGLDSSLIVALMKQHSAHVKTFSIGFGGDDSFNETPYAEQVAKRLGTDHTTFRVEADALDLLPKLVWHHDQPFGDSSAIPTYLVSKLAREHVTVALTGDGGDELFAGYERFYAAELARSLGKTIPRSAWRMLSHILEAVPEGSGYYNTIKRGRRFARAASMTPAYAYFDLVRLFSADLVRDLTRAPYDPAALLFVNIAQKATLPDLLLANMTTYLPDDLLIKTDRSAMAASLEGRAPILDHALVELAAKIPANLKLNGRTTKYILKQAARGLLPDSIIDRPKHGFGVPLGAWLRRDLSRGSASLIRETLLSPEAQSRNLLNRRAVESIIEAHASGRRDHGGRLWGLLTLEWWHRLFIDQFPAESPPNSR